MIFEDDESGDVKFIPNQAPRRNSLPTLERPILNFDPENPTSFKIWRQKWESWIYMASSGEVYLTELNKYHYLISCFSDTTMKHVFELGFEDEKNTDKIIDGLANLLMNSRKNHHRYRFEFNSRTQLMNESLESWLAWLKSKAKLAKFDSDCCSKCLDSRILERLIVGVNSPQVRELLLDVGPGLTLDQALRLIQKFEQTRVTPFGNRTKPATHNQNLSKIPGATSVTLIKADDSSRPFSTLQSHTKINESAIKAADENNRGSFRHRLASVSRLNNLTVTSRAVPSTQASSRPGRSNTKPSGQGSVGPRANVGTNLSIPCGPDFEIIKCVPDSKAIVHGQARPRPTERTQRSSTGNGRASNGTTITFLQVSHRSNSGKPENQRNLDNDVIEKGTKRKSGSSSRLEPVNGEPIDTRTSRIIDNLPDSNVVFDIRVKSEESEEPVQEVKKRSGRTRGETNSFCFTCGVLQPTTNLDKKRDCRACRELMDLTKRRQPQHQQLAPIQTLPTSPKS